MRPFLAALMLVMLLGVGCDSEEEATPAPSPATAEERVVREWITALNKGDYKEAARYFAKGAIVDQGRPIKLPNAAAARFFNASLPCRAELVDVEDEPGPRALASFTLSEGPGGPCEGRARVRVTIKDGLFTEWRQLPQGPEPSGPVV
ncbi:MAG TPA: hypothetical protein VES62_01235 [Thermoleophilaceae bacterium]|nr:hypothetical protein [Thermoleophilaceae bacterium]